MCLGLQTIEVVRDTGRRGTNAVEELLDRPQAQPARPGDSLGAEERDARAQKQEEPAGAVSHPAWSSSAGAAQCGSQGGTAARAEPEGFEAVEALQAASSSAEQWAAAKPGAQAAAAWRPAASEKAASWMEEVSQPAEQPDGLAAQLVEASSAAQEEPAASIRPVCPVVAPTEKDSAVAFARGEWLGKPHFLGHLVAPSRAEVGKSPHLTFC